MGLFGRIGVDDTMHPDYTQSGRVTDLHLTNVSITGSRLANVGAIAGEFSRGTVEHVTVTGTITNQGNTGGIAAEIEKNATVRRALCHVTIVNDGVGIVGGIVGENDGGAIRRSAATGKLVGSNHVDLGGLAGWQANGSLVSNSYSTATIETSGADSLAGGLVAKSRPTATVRNCYAAGWVTGDATTGGLIAIGKADCRYSFWDENATTQTQNYGGTGLETGAMQRRKTFAGAGWDFEETWMMAVYPRLRWVQNPDTLPTDEGTTPMSSVRLGQNDTGRTLEVERGRTIVIELAENPSTGYEWTYSDSRPVARVLEDRYIRSETPDIGDAGTRMVRLEVRESGTFRMSYERPWTDEPPEQVFAVHFAIVSGS